MSLMNEWDRVSHFLSFNDAGLPPVGSDRLVRTGQWLEGEGEREGKEKSKES